MDSSIPKVHARALNPLSPPFTPSNMAGPQRAAASGSAMENRLPTRTSASVKPNPRAPPFAPAMKKARPARTSASVKPDPRAPPFAPAMKKARPARPLAPVMENPPRVPYAESVMANPLRAPPSTVVGNPPSVPYAQPVMDNPSRAPPPAIFVGGHMYAHGVLIGGALVVPYGEPVMENPLRAPPSGFPTDNSLLVPYDEPIMENPLRAPPCGPVMEDTLRAPHAHPTMQRPLSLPYSATVMNNQLTMPADGQPSHGTQPTRNAPGPYCKPEDLNIKQKCWDLLMNFQLKRDTIVKWDILLRDPISEQRKELAEGLCEGMSIIKACMDDKECMDELEDAMPDRHRYLSSRVWNLQILLSTLLDTGIGFEPMPAPACLLEFLRHNPCRFSDQFRNVIRQTYLDGKSLELGAARP